MSDPLDPLLEQQLTHARAREERDLGGREAFGRLVMTGAFFAASVPLALIAETERHPVLWVYLAFVAGYALLSSIQFEVGSGVALPTGVVFVPMLFALPAAHVPLVVAGGLLLAAVPDVTRRRLSPARAAVQPGNAVFSLAPALVFVAAGEPHTDWRGGAVLLVALVAQFALDLGSSCLHEWLALGVPPRDLLRPLAWTFAIDALIAPFAFAAAVAEEALPGALLLPIPLVVLLAIFARERRERLDSLLELSGAYRGTAFLLGDVVEADDAYTGDHSRQVVELVLAVCDRMGVSPRDRRVAEFAALLHDVGKIRIPSHIINKPGRLTADERAVIETHTVEGERLLRRVGGLLGDVGTIVRSCHERWDGAGYPDGLAGAEIPLLARIVSACDAYNAMTTDRPYRRSIGSAAAVAELRANRGTQLDPAVVDALLAVVGSVVLAETAGPALAA